MANVDNPNGFTCIGTLHGGKTPPMKAFTLATNQTIHKGDALIATNIGTTNTVQIALSNSGLIHAVAGEDLTTTSSTDTIMGYPADPNYLFEGQCSGTYAAASHDFAAADIEGTTGIMEINENANTESVLQILGMVNDGKNEAGANARVVFRFIRSSYTPLLAAL